VLTAVNRDTWACGPSPQSARITEATVIAAPSSVRPQPNARKAKGGAPSGRWNFAATVVVAGARGLSRRERSHDRRQRFQADHPRPSGQDGRVLPNSPADTR